MATHLGPGPDIENAPPEPFPLLSNPPSPPPRRSTAEHEARKSTSRTRQDSSSSSIQLRLRSASKSFQESSVPTGMWIATGQIATSIPSIAEIRRGSFGSNGWSGEGQIIEKERRESVARRKSSLTGEDASPRRTSVNQHTNTAKQYSLGQDISCQAVAEGEEQEQVSRDPRTGSDGPSTSPMFAQQEERRADKQDTSDVRTSSDTTPKTASKASPQAETAPFQNGYQFPPKHTWSEATVIALTAFWKFFITPLGFIVTIYCLNVVAWGGMLFLLLCNASPAMCTPTCNDINSPRRIWIEIDSQILNSLFCVTGFGTIPWRFRDLYYLMQYRLQKKEIGLRRLAGINRGWFRLEGSENLPVGLGPAEVEMSLNAIPQSSIPFPTSKTPKAPLTGTRAPPTAVWKLDFVIWMMVWNTFLQAVLSGFMWGFNRRQRPSWSTGLFVALACIVAAIGGIASAIEGKRVKSIEGVPVSPKDMDRLQRDQELGIIHYNNIKDEDPKEKKQKGLFNKKRKEKDISIEGSRPEEAIK